jgi:hypothetical protein
MKFPPRVLLLLVPSDVLSTPDVEPMLRAGDAWRDRELSGRYGLRFELDAAKGDEGIGMDESGREGDIGVSEGEVPRGRLYGSKRSSG